MQGKLSEIDIRSILQLIELGQRTGELFVEAYSPSSAGGNLGRSGNRIFSPESLEQSWFVFFLNGQIIYAAEPDNGLARLRDYLRRYRLEATLNRIEVSAIATTNALEYGYLWALLEQHLLTPAQGRSIIQGMVQETLFDLLGLHQGAFIFEVGSALSPQLMTLEINSLVTKIVKQVQEWKQFHPHIQSPDQCPVIADPVHLRSTLPENLFKSLNRWIDGKTSMRQVGRYLNRDVLTVARAIYPYVQQGAVQLVSTVATETVVVGGGKSASPAMFRFLPEARVPRVVCIDDGSTVRETVETILKQHGYEATAIGNPLKALSLVFQLKPDLILCDIAMPELDGYEICAMLRKSTAFRQTPIVMLTGKDGFIDRVKARMVGSTDYLTKPFGENELLMLVEKYVGLGNPDRPKPSHLLANALKDELEIEMNESISTPSPFAN